MTTSPPTDHFSLHDSLAVVLPHLSSALASAPAVRQVQALADTLLPIPRALLECHLGDPALPLDVSQCVFPAERDWFAAFARGRTGWPVIAAFADEWQNPASLLADGIENVWLEFDTGRSPLPGVFLKLREAGDSQPCADQWQVAENALKLLLPNHHDHLRRCFEIAGDVGIVTHVGVMLSRPSTAVRLNVAVESAAAAQDYLNACGWPGLPPPLAETFEQVFEYVQHPILTLDAGEVISPRIGLECVPGHRYILDEAWERFLGFLLERRLCSVEQAAALRAWPGYSDPTRSDEWPLYLMLKTLAQPTASLDVLIRQLNHIKLVFQPDAPMVAAKAYLGYNHENINPAELPIKPNTPLP